MILLQLTITNLILNASLYDAVERHHITSHILFTLISSDQWSTESNDIHRYLIIVWEFSLPVSHIYSSDWLLFVRDNSQNISLFNKNIVKSTCWLTIHYYLAYKKMIIIQAISSWIDIPVPVRDYLYSSLMNELNCE